MMTTMWTLIGGLIGMLATIFVYNLGYFPDSELARFVWLVGAVLGWLFGKWLDTVYAKGRE
jgi:hypothetical protein